MRTFVPIPRCPTCGNRIWNPDWWSHPTGKCGPCVTFDISTMFPENWVNPREINMADNEGLRAFMRHWAWWYHNIYKKYENITGYGKI